MYLSRLILDSRNRFVRRDMSNCHDLHRTVLSAFPDMGNPGVDARSNFGILHRLDISPRSGMISLLVQSMTKPDWSKIPDGYLLKESGLENPACKTIDEQLNAIYNGSVLIFRLRANPTRKVKNKKAEINADSTKDNGRRVPLSGEDAQIGWLCRKSEDSGFKLLRIKATNEPCELDTIVCDEGSVSGRQNSVIGVQSFKDGRKSNNLSFASVLFEGKLIVTDREKFINAINSGIGSGKAYGFGLLSVARPR